MNNHNGVAVWERAGFKVMHETDKIVELGAGSRMVYLEKSISVKPETSDDLRRFLEWFRN